MSNNTYKVLITTSGVGERLGDITKYTNKALVKLGKKPVISYIIELYPKDTEYIVTTGYFADHVKDLLTMCYPDRKFTFVQVDRYLGKGSSLGYSMLQAKHKLQSPFIYHASDTVVRTRPPKATFNWAGGYKGVGASNYRSFKVIGKKLDKVSSKGALDTDYIHIGLIGVKDHKSFWANLEKLYKKYPDNQSLSDVHAINGMIEEGKDFHVHPFDDWLDIGNVQSLQQAREKIQDTHHILDKLGESIFLFDTHVVKFFFDEKMVRDRVKRAKILKILVPKLLETKKNFYKYKYAKGDLYSDVANPNNFDHFLSWSKTKLWKKTQETSKEKFSNICYDFYYTKSLARVNHFLKSNHIKDSKNIINDEKVPMIAELFKSVDFKWLCDTEQSHFHGDFILDNIIRTKTGYTLLDWRQNFGGLTKAGDIYYDLAKLNHNLTVNHNLVTNNLFTIDITPSKITCDILRKNNLVECQSIFYSFLKHEGYDVQKVKVLTAIIWLNMSALHHHPFDLFLYFFGKLHLYQALQYEKKH